MLLIDLTSHSLVGCVDWNLVKMPSKVGTTQVALSCRVRGLKLTKVSYNQNARKPSHSLVGCVDWNIKLCFSWVQGTPVALSCRVRGLKSNPKYRLLPRPLSHSLVGCVDWNNQCIMQAVDATVSHSLVGCVDWNCMAVLGPLFARVVALSCRVRGLK